MEILKLSCHSVYSPVVITLQIRPSITMILFLHYHNATSIIIALHICFSIIIIHTRILPKMKCLWILDIHAVYVRLHEPVFSVSTNMLVCDLWHFICDFVQNQYLHKRVLGWQDASLGNHDQVLWLPWPRHSESMSHPTVIGCCWSYFWSRDCGL